MALPDVKTVVADPDFQGLPDQEKAKVLQQIDPDFAGLPQDEQVKAVSGLASVSQPVATQSHKPLEGSFPTRNQPLGAFAQGALDTAFAGAPEALASRVGANADDSGSPKFTNPYLYATGQTVGGFLPLGTIAKSAGMAKTLGRQMLQGARLGAILGGGRAVSEAAKQPDVTLGEAVEQGLTGGALGAGIGAVLPAGARTLPKASELAQSAVQNVKNVIAPETRNLIKQALRFSTGKGVRVDKIIDDSTQAILERKLPVEDLPTYLSSTQNARKQIAQEANALLVQAGKNTEIDPTQSFQSIVDDIVKRNPALKRGADKRTLEELNRIKDTFSGPMTLEDAENQIQIWNSELQTLFRERNIRPVELIAFPIENAKDKFRYALRNLFTDKIDSITGKNSQKLRDQYGALSELEETLVKRTVNSERQAPMNLPQSMALFEGVGQGMESLQRGEPIRALVQAGARPLVASKGREFQDPNNMIARAFQGLAQGKSLKPAPPTSKAVEDFLRQTALSQAIQGAQRTLTQQPQQ